MNADKDRLQVSYRRSSAFIGGSNRFLEARAMGTRKQAAASRENGLKGGVKTDRGKAISRLNARKHGIFVSALTEQDAEEVYVIEDELIASLRPVGRVEEMLVEKLALTYLRMQRCARTEAELHARTWAEPREELERHRWEQLEMERLYGGRGVAFREDVFERMVSLIELYDARLTNQFLKLLHEIERMQRRREGEEVSPPVVAEVTIQTDAGDVCSEPAESPQKAADVAPDGATTNEGTPPAESEITVQAEAAEGREVECALPDDGLPPAPGQLPDAADREEPAQVAT
jgi:hypothetical protein